jgi:hypothetical protein
MNNSPDNERLLADVLAEESEPGFRELLLSQTLHLVRRQRRFRKIRRATSAVAVIAGLLLLAWRFLPSPSNGPATPAKPYTLVHTQPLPASAIVGTTPFPPSDVITSVGSVEIIATSAVAHNFRELNDDQLLDLMTPTPALLVRRGPHTAELVFLNAEDREAFLRN